MSEPAESADSGHSTVESVMEKISEKIHAHDSSSSSDSESESDAVRPESPSSVKAKIFRLFGRERPVHQVFGGGKRKAFASFVLCVFSDCFVARLWIIVSD